MILRSMNLDIDKVYLKRLSRPSIESRTGFVSYRVYVPRKSVLV